MFFDGAYGQRIIYARGHISNERIIHIVYKVVDIAELSPAGSDASSR